MRRLSGICLLVTTLLTVGASAHVVYQTETFVGIGAVLEKTQDGRVRVDALIANAPAAQSAMAIGDTILAVKSLPSSPFVDVRSLTLQDIVALIRGPVGVPVELSVTRAGAQPTILSIIRNKFEVDDGQSLRP